MATRTRSPEVLARRRGRCRHCDKPIVQGDDYIARVDGRKDFMHARCADEYIRARETYEELNREDGTP